MRKHRYEDDMLKPITCMLTLRINVKKKTIYWTGEMVKQTKKQNKAKK